MGKLRHRENKAFPEVTGLVWVTHGSLAAILWSLLCGPELGKIADLRLAQAPGRRLLLPPHM